MLFAIIQEIIVGIAVSAVLEFWIRLKNSRTRNAAVAQTRRSGGAGNTILTITKIILAPLIGFVLAGLVSGIMEAEGTSEITLGSSTSLVLIAVGTFVAWVLLSLVLDRFVSRPQRGAQSARGKNSLNNAERGSSPLAATVANMREDSEPELKAQSIDGGVMRRMNSAVGTILDNEALTDNLDDAAAKVLLDWGVACAEMIVHSTAGLSDNEFNNEAEPRLRATRRLMRQINRWVPTRPRMSYEENAEKLDEIVEKAAVVYGEGYVPPDDSQRVAFLKQYLDAAPREMIEELRILIGTK